MKESPSSLKGKSNQGEIINFLQVDSMKISMMMTSSPNMLVTPVLISIYTYLLFKFFGIAFLYGFIALIIFISINFYIQNLYRIKQKELLKRKDERIKITSETINSLKILKLYAWEDEFLERVIIYLQRSEISELWKCLKSEKFTTSLLLISSYFGVLQLLFRQFLLEFINLL
jgi:ABC-type bacteriocin/lantibiotic exporter with double-glycine peptidase domain